MNTVDTLVDFLNGIDGKGYKAYKGLRGTWAFPDFVLHVDHVQGDPFAAPSRVRVILPPETATLEDDVLTSRSRRLGVASLLAKRFDETARRTMVRRGSGKSGLLEIETQGQAVLAQTAVIVGEHGTVEARFGSGCRRRGGALAGMRRSRCLRQTFPRSWTGASSRIRWTPGYPAARTHQRGRRRVTGGVGRTRLGHLRRR